jgi:hypothetical protein
MLVYGDHREAADPRERLGRIAAELVQVAAMPPGIERHAALVGALIDAGQLLQGAEDSSGPSPPLSAFLYRLAQCVIRSSDSGFREAGKLPIVPRLSLPARVELKLPEGFAFYALYPEAYIAAARRLKLIGPARVIGIRSIGTTLGAIVAAALDARPPATVRPFGDPFVRQVELPEELLERDAHYVIVDEGPGLSGSSFGAVADWLQDHGVPLERIAFLPSHGGDLGPHASAAHRERWSSAHRVPAEFDPHFLRERFGPLAPFTTGSAGGRLKFLGWRNGERVLLKFAGLGSIGARKLDMARGLHAAGFTPEPLGLVHGFLVERWCGGARPLGAGDTPVEEIGHYIGARARLFPAPDRGGATIDELMAMTRRNITLTFGNAAADRVGPFASLAERARVRTDNKLDRREWLRDRDGRLLKTDALDHHQAHDLIGCQPPEWDVAGAIAEFALGTGQTDRLIAATGLPIDAPLLAFFRLAYRAFRLGQAVLFGSPNANAYRRQVELLLEHDASESARILA